MSMVRADAWLRLPRTQRSERRGDRRNWRWWRTPTGRRHTWFSLAGSDRRAGSGQGFNWFISPGWSLFREYTGHEVGFELLRKGGCHAVAIHGDRWEGGFSGIIRIRVAEREMGWITSATAPEPVSGVADLIRLGLRLINRPPGSATRKRLTYSS